VVSRQPRVVQSLPRLVALLGLVVTAVAVTRLLAVDRAHADVVPIALTGLILTVAYDREFALVTVAGLALLVTQALGTGMAHFIILMLGTAVAVSSLTNIRTRTKLIKVGFLAGLTYFALTCATGVLTHQYAGFLLSDGLWRWFWGLMAGFVISGTLPFVERFFGIVTDISLLELGDITHPLLQELVRRAPGTYNHSITVATIAEAGAEQIGANSLLARVGSYFHDIGKMLKPQYFVENQSDAVNRHDNLNPAMSTLIIIGHVKDGADLARQHGLPQPLIDFIEQHHGTTLVEYFYHEAASRMRTEGGEEPGEVAEAAFRYPGPKPQSKEAGVVMLADAVESASRALSEPTPSRIESLVRDIALKRLLDGQFDESGLNLRELRAIEDSLTKSLIAFYHGRVKYPEPRTA